jgi:hypothetical protein
VGFRLIRTNLGESNPHRACRVGGVRGLIVLGCRALSAEEAAAGVDVLMREEAESKLEFLGLIIFRNEPKVSMMHSSAVRNTRPSDHATELLRISHSSMRLPAHITGTMNRWHCCPYS